MENNKMVIAERDMKIVNYMAGLVGADLDRMDSSAKEMIKYNTGILTVLTAMAKFFEIGIQPVLVPIVLIFIGIVAFIYTTQVSTVKYVVGEVSTSVQAFEKLSKRKLISIRIGFGATYLGFFIFMIRLIR